MGFANIIGIGRFRVGTRPTKRRRNARWAAFLISFAVLWAVVVVWNPSNVFAAIADPDTINIEDVRAYDSVLEANDLLIIVEYNLAYSSTPAELISDAYLGRFRRGTAELNAVDPFAFNDNGYGRGIFSLYWTAAQKTTDSIEFNDTNSEAYTVTLQGKIGVFPGGVPTTTTNTILWQDATDTRNLLEAQIAALARKFEQDSGWADDTDFDDLIESPGGTDQLTSRGVGTGEEYFGNAVPQLRSMIPGLFSSGVSSPDFTEETFDKSYSEDLKGFWATDGAWVDTKFTTLADRYQVPKRTLTSLVAIAFMMIIVWFTSKLLDGTDRGWQFGVMTVALTLPMFTAVGWIPLEVTMIIATVAVLGITWTLWGRRAGG